MRIRTPLAIILIAAFAIGCDKDGEEEYDDLVGNDPGNTIVAMSMSYTHNGTAFDTSMTLTDEVGTLFKVQRIRFYMGGFRFTDDNNDSVASFPSKYLLIDSHEGGDYRTIGQLRGHLHQMTFSLGVDSVSNHSDPGLMAPPLGYTGVYWTWAQGYLFLTIDGLYDSNGDGVVGSGDAGMSYHCGMDELYTLRTLEVHTDADNGGNLVLPLALNVDTLMSHLDIATTPLAHELSPVTQGLMANLAAGLSHIE